MTKLIYPTLIVVALLIAEKCLADGDSTASATPPTKNGPTSTKTVYGFLDFTTTVSDTVMIFRPSKTHSGNKGRAVGRTASVLLSKPARPAVKVEATQPTLEPTSASTESDEGFTTEVVATGRSGSLGGGRIRHRPQRPGEVVIEGSLISFDEPKTSTERLAKATRKLAELTGKGSIGATFPVMHSHVEVSSRVDIRIGGLANKNSGSSGNKISLPKQVEVRSEMRLAPETEAGKRQRVSAGQSIVSKTTGTRIMNGVTTVHETSVIGTTIDGQYAHFVQSTSRVFTEPSAAPPAIPGFVEVVTELPSINSIAAARKPSSSATSKSPTPPPTTTKTTTPKDEAEDKTDVLPSLESLFKSVVTSSHEKESEKEDEQLPEPEQLVDRKTTASPIDDQDDEESAAVILKPVIRVNTTPSPSKSTTQGALERRAGLASPPKLNLQPVTPRPARTEDQRWRYNPSPKPKVAIQRTSTGPGSRFRERAPTGTTPRDVEPDHETPAPSYQQQHAEPEIDPTEVITLRVQTVTPEGYSNLFYEVATIKSPYIMRLGNIRNTRYVTLTRSFTRLITPTQPPTVTPTAYEQLPEPESDIDLESSQPLPDPENILATTGRPYEKILKDSSDTATLPAIIVAATESDLYGFNLNTVTETFSTTELTMKTSILPYLRAGVTSLMTLTQSYYVTRVVVAVKTVPPLDVYQFIPSKTLTDISTNLQEEGSEHNDRLFPGELEFSENDEFDDDEAHRHEKRVTAPEEFPGLQSDLSSIGQDFDLSAVDRPLSHQLDLEPSLVDPASEPTSTKKGTPPLPNFPILETSINNPLRQYGQHQETPMLSPEQLQQLALFRYMNPYAAAGLPFGYPGLPGFGAPNAGVQVIQTSRPVVKTQDIIRTETVPIWDGARTFYSTVTRVKGTTVVTETEYGTTTIPAQVNPLFAPQQQFTVVSSPVVTEITTTSTELRIYRIIFRAQTTYTTVTSTTVFPTTVTTYVSSTIPIQPTAFPQGLFPGSFGFPAFG